MSHHLLAMKKKKKMCDRHRVFILCEKNKNNSSYFLFVCRFVCLFGRLMKIDCFSVCVSMCASFFTDLLSVIAFTLDLSPFNTLPTQLKCILKLHSLKDLPDSNINLDFLVCFLGCFFFNKISVEIYLFPYLTSFLLEINGYFFFAHSHRMKLFKTAGKNCQNTFEV